MITKNRRLTIITELVNAHSPNSQGRLLKLLHERGFVITQTTLSRDIKQLKISKMPNDNGDYVYMNPPKKEASQSSQISIKENFVPLMPRGFISFEFSYQSGVIKTRHGYASGIALEIKKHASSVILGAIAGDDTVLLIPKENVTREEIVEVLIKIIPGMKKEDSELATKN